jgi:hypothetical protein
MKTFTVWPIFNAISLHEEKEDFRKTNLKELFKSSIFFMAEIEQVYDTCFDRLQKKSKGGHSPFILHTRAKDLTNRLLQIKTKLAV